jgi:asparagine synthase (glutamine-hydrolysing)
MCSIAGIAGNNISAGEKKITVERFLEELKHRGPDGMGIWEDHLITLGHNRLSIIDLSIQSGQPMHMGDWVIAYNGEVYNYLELRKELSTDYDFVFMTESDTEVILAAWSVWGEKALERFRGMWAFAIYNKRSNILFLCRDRFGIKPLYYSFRNNELLFASEIKALLKSELVSRTAYLPAIVDFMIGFHDHCDTTFFKDIIQIPPAHFLKVDLNSKKAESIKYYDLNKATAAVTSDLDDFKIAFNETINLHLRSDVKTGTCLSGGIDSSAVAIEASRQMLNFYNKPFFAVTAQSEEADNDETRFAEEVVKKGHINWYKVKPGVDDFLNNWKKCLWYQDEPVFGPSIFMQYMVMKEASEQGIKVMLDGQGGDELLLGYERYYPAYFLHLVKRKSFSRVIKAFFEAVDNSKLNHRQMLAYSAYFLIPQIRFLVQKKKLKSLPKELVKESLDRLMDSSRSYRNIREMQIAEITKFQLPHLLKYEDRNSMAWSVEARVPFIDHVIVEKALTLKPDLKIKDGYTKWALRKIMEDELPENIIWRKNKIGFEAPVNKWLPLMENEMNLLVEKSKLLKYLGLANLKNNKKDDLFLPYTIACWEAIYHVS